MRAYRSVGIACGVSRRTAEAQNADSLAPGGGRCSSVRGDALARSAAPHRCQIPTPSGSWALRYSAGGVPAPG